MAFLNTPNPLGPLKAFANDPLSQLRSGIDNGQRVPVTKTMTSYSMTIHARVNGKQGVIGAVHEIGLNQTQTIDEEYEVDSLGKGIPREIIPQILSSRTLTLQRYELYTATMEQVFGQPALITLADQVSPVSVRLLFKRPEPSDVAAVLQNNSKMTAYEFTNCTISNLTKTYSMGNIIVGANATLIWRDIVPLL